MIYQIYKLRFVCLMIVKLEHEFSEATTVSTCKQKRLFVKPPRYSHVAHALCSVDILVYISAHSKPYMRVNCGADLIRSINTSSKMSAVLTWEQLCD